MLRPIDNNFKHVKNLQGILRYNNSNNNNDDDDDDNDIDSDSQ